MAQPQDSTNSVIKGCTLTLTLLRTRIASPKLRSFFYQRVWLIVSDSMCRISCPRMTKFSSYGGAGRPLPPRVCGPFLLSVFMQPPISLQVCCLPIITLYLFLRLNKIKKKNKKQYPCTPLIIYTSPYYEAIWTPNQHWVRLSIPP